mmetsp:Transcript_52435/g.93452  ORF Transcript_52435/g.93452 Transcript_52435/m.93452 type:complete len:239 (-) Transcript_52435:95-811(-)
MESGLASGRSSARSQPMLTSLSNVKSSPKWSLHGKARTSGRSIETPGPGSYTHSDPDVNKYKRAPGYGFGVASREGYRPASAPGPGAYSPRDKKALAASWGFGTSGRRGVPARMDQPGPGCYNTPSRIGNEGPKYSASPRREMNLNASTPGPGSYDSVNPRAVSPRGTPAAGSSAKWGFGTSPREGRSLAINPGPGAYDGRSYTDNGPKYSFRGRTGPNNPRSSPGPGEYGGAYTQFG